jgi:hypothetical protein
MVRRGTRIDVQMAPVPGQAIGDVTRGFLDDGMLEFLQTDGTPIGTITVLGFVTGPPPPGAPVAQNAWNMAVTGGTGRFWERAGRSARRFQWAGFRGLAYKALPPKIPRSGAFSVDGATA